MNTASLFINHGECPRRASSSINQGVVRKRDCAAFALEFRPPITFLPAVQMASFLDAAPPIAPSSQQMFLAQGIKRPRDDDNSEGNFKNSTSAPAPHSAPPAAAAPATVADTQEAVGHSYAALTQLVTFLHAKVPALRFDVDLASWCAAVLAAAVADASKAATLGQNVAAAATKPLISQAVSYTHLTLPTILLV